MNFFGYFKQTNHISLSSVGFATAAIFLRNHDFCIVELLGIKGYNEINLLWEDEPPYWITQEHYLSISDLLEKDFDSPISHAEIKLANGGEINYSAASLIVRYPEGKDLKAQTIQLLETMGYYSATEIIEFCETNPGMHLISFVLGMKPNEITDEFERMRRYTTQMK